MTAMPRFIPVDLSDDASFKDGFPQEHFTWLRENDPVHWHAPTPSSPDGEGMWVVSRYEDIMYVLRNAELFSSNTGGDRTGGGTTMKDERAAGKILNYTDDPHHRVLRGLVNKGFTNQTIGALEGELRRRTNLLIDAFPTGEVFDFVPAFSRELPAQAICIVLGVPQGDRGQLIDWIDKGIAGDSQNVMAKEFYVKIRDYAKGIIAEKRRNPGDDILTKIVQARLDEEDGRALTDEELVNFFVLLFPAGAETTRGAIGGGLRALIEHPDQLQQMRDDPALVKTAVEEFVRWMTPSIYKRRTVTEDTELGGKTLKRGDKVTIWEMSANRDSAIFDRPFEFDVSRRPNRHIGFGFGAHVCLGAALARLEIKVALEELLRRIEHFELAGPAVYVPNNRLLGLRHLNLSVTMKEAKT
ncbi:MAG: cytochrome P450 [Rhodospirillaceae bacterium]|jgi:cytochrome P450|nr:cytochrome P450 [Rhodospirillaceae bacterium]MBT4691535.1 cytochrome P450 [Rhodospirillaceae bacterium]MBT5083038.1 cytochrome P450 [Rhodospirillaceae bacterium]MBT5524482.1 cytochrome P450 [Rhodospirillaceae bacterium]MBT5881670.1 cytochrome P450 [Rhodospirillaceae bacterium]